MARGKLKPVCPIQKRHCIMCGRETTHVLHIKGGDNWRCLEEATHKFHREADECEADDPGTGAAGEGDPQRHLQGGSQGG